MFVRSAGKGERPVASSIGRLPTPPVLSSHFVSHVEAAASAGRPAQCSEQPAQKHTQTHQPGNHEKKKTQTN